jgi:UDP-arabinose 4-epimerase
MRSVLVTGGAGYVGSHACKALAEAGFQPVVLDNLSTGHRWAVKWGPLEIGDINDQALVTDLLKRYRVEAVMHFAAYSQVGQSVRDPGLYYANNVGGSLALLQAMRSADVNRIVFSSTCATYGMPERLPIREDAAQNPINPYGRSKLAVEYMLGDFAAAYGLRAAALRYFNAAGAAADAGIGEAHEPETHLIPLVIATALGQRGPVEIFGEDYPTLDGTCQRDYIHVADLASAHLKALDLLNGEPALHAFNLGTGQGYSVREIIAAVEKVAGNKVPQKIAPRRAGDPPALYADPSKALAQLGWKATQSSIAEIVESAWRWHRGGQQLAV